MKRFFVVETDNFGSDYPDEKVVPIRQHMNRTQAQGIANAFNQAFCEGGTGSRFWKVEEEGYKLQPGFEP